MNLERERELFERYEHSKKPCANRNKLFEVFIEDGLDVDEYHYIGKYVCSFMQEKWELWLASASRDGYKLVPVEPTQEMIYEGESAEHIGCISVKTVYKAMIDAAV